MLVSIVFDKGLERRGTGLGTGTAVVSSLGPKSCSLIGAENKSLETVFLCLRKSEKMFGFS